MHALIRISTVHLLLLLAPTWLSVPAAQTSQESRTHLRLVEGRWQINGRLTNPGTPAEGLMMNVRMVNAVFEDRARPEFDAEANTDRFIAKIPSYAASGVNAFTLCLQGGMPGYEGAVNSAFNPDGSLRSSYLRRVRRAIEACGRSGKGIPADTRSKPGSGGQIVAFVPSLDLVLARQTGGSGSWDYEGFLRLACACVTR